MYYRKVGKFNFVIKSSSFCSVRETSSKNERAFNSKMEFTFDLGHIFRHEISEISEDMLPEGGVPATSPGNSLGLTQQRVMEILDRMGEASARAQGQKEIPDFIHSSKCRIAAPHL